MALRVFAVDDERLGLQRLELQLKAIAEAELVGQTDDSRQALDLIRHFRPDVVIMNVQMVPTTGLEIARTLMEARDPPEIIFLSTLGQHAVEAFEVRAADFLVKPVLLERLRTAVRRAGERLTARQADHRLAELHRLVDEAQSRQQQAPGSYEHELWVRGKEGLSRIPVSEIEVLRAEGDYVSARSGEREHLIRGTVSALAQRLDPDKFLRVHRSAIINVAHVRRLRRRSRRALTITLGSGEQVHVGPSYTETVLNALGAPRWR